MQRIGRAGHQVGQRASQDLPGIELICSKAVVDRMHQELIEETLPGNPLDVLGQQLVAMCDGRLGSADLRA